MPVAQRGQKKKDGSIRDSLFRRLEWIFSIGMWITYNAGPLAYWAIQLLPAFSSELRVLPKRESYH